MKFGEQIREQKSQEWAQHYLDYDGLKQKLKKAESDSEPDEPTDLKSSHYTERDESEFVAMLDTELEKVNAFQATTFHSLATRVREAAVRVQAIQFDSTLSASGLQDEINAIADDINRLSRYAQINYTGFLKIVKKHDRHTPYVLRPMFMVRLQQCPFWKADYDPLLIQLSELFIILREGGRPMSFNAPSSLGTSPIPISSEMHKLGTSPMLMSPSSQGLQSRFGSSPMPIAQGLKDNLPFVGSPTVQGLQNFQRRSTKYWVHPDNVMEVKTSILKHLPVLIYNTQKKSSVGGSDSNVYTNDPPITSIYLDNATFDLYHSKVERSVNSQALRLRWYGSGHDVDRKGIFVERKIQYEEELGESKDRFIVKDKYIDAFLKGDYTIGKTTNKLREAGRSETDIQQLEQLATEIQSTVVDRNLQPVLRTFYNRTAFQMPGDMRVRISLDTNLALIREDSHLFPDDPTERRPSGAWRRPDVDIDYPFSDLSEESGEIVRFPYAVLEVKLSGPKPRWVNELENSGLLEEAPGFSKFVHGIAVLFEQRVSLLPFWLAQLDKDVELRPPVPSLTFAESSNVIPKKKPKKSPHHSTSNSLDLSSNLLTSRPGNYGAIPSSNTSQPHRRGSLTPHKAKLLGPRKPKAFSIQSLLLGQSSSERARGPIRYPLPPHLKPPRQLPSPVKVEPKIFFANERTFLSWLSFSTLLATLAIALFNSGDSVGRISGVFYTLVAITAMIHAMGSYNRRREMIRSRHPGPYDDLVGPTVVCIALFIAVGLNTYLKFTVKQKHHAPGN